MPARGAGKIFGSEEAVAMADHIRSRYDTALKAANAVDFDDLLVLTLKLFQEHPDALEECRQRYQYVTVDEYQDTNAAQYELMHLLAKEHRMCAWWAMTTKASTAGAGRRFQYSRFGEGLSGDQSH